METILDLILNGENIRMLVILAALGCVAMWLNSQTDKKIAALEKKFDKKFDAIDRRFEAIDKKFDAIDRKFDAIDKKFDAIEKRFDILERRMGRLEEAIKDLVSAVSAMTFVLKRNSVITEDEKTFVDSFLPKQDARVEPNIAA